ncbi:gliding motility-associated C-terminal domain-containing protein [Hymenobacter busanensis]|uniref:Gliding motility-associated C-terminal domain-containing protein n=1 Tax=Hymenobacter busanensis TaxID=2607656 RepID=A0A7L4ZZ14_9BACT|nr:T9SS type B sorting domain-containing protein [Hymenobacter busanensis]KAA9339535.1 gliding motility-associated C-terminal domain-containing protein [Hymenobacter busanensis]QHJ06710.1 T9SS type B sorting domain-containing protein [Hymenobacter busanensis]
MKCFFVAWLLMLGFAALPAAQAQCNYPVVAGVNANFRVFVPNTTHELQVLCAGSSIELRDASGRTLDPAQVYYKLTDANTCAPTFTPADISTTLTVPNAAGRVRIHQLTPNTSPGGTGGILFVREFEVRPRPTVSTFTVATCGLGRDQVLVTIPPQPGVQYFVQVGNGPRSAATTTGGVYAVPAGAISVTVTANYPDLTVCETVSVPQLIPTAVAQRPVLQRLVVRGNNLVFAIASPGLQADFRYQPLQGGTPVGPPVRADSTSFTLPGAALNSCYSLQLNDACGNTLYTSDPLCPVALTATPGDRRNELSWTIPAGSAVSGYDVLRDNQRLVSLAPGVTTYADAAVTCGRTYRYRVVAKVGAATSLSDVKPVTTAATTAPSVPQLSATFNVANGVELTLLQPAQDTADRLVVRRTLGSSAPQTLTGNRLPIVDQPGAVSLTNAPCYSAQFRDPCGNASAFSASVCPPVLDASAIATDPNGNAVQLRWTEPAGQGTTWAYRLLLLDGNNQVIRSTALTTSTPSASEVSRPTDPQLLRYRLEARSGSLTVFSNVATVAREVRIVVPTAFTPNGDGLNDALLPKGRFLRNVSFTVFDRNGVVVFRGTNPTDGWDGRINGVQAAPQVFTYQVDVVDEAGKRVSQRGTVTLLR